MPVATLISLGEYLDTSYEHDCEYVDGEVVERGMPVPDHATVQTNTAAWFHARRRELGIYVMTEARVQVSPTRVRVPDVCIGRLPRPGGKRVTVPPLICFEVRSPDDRPGRLRERVEEYLALGVPQVAELDPETRRVWVHTPDGRREVLDGLLPVPEINAMVPLADLFADLDEDD